MLPYTGHHYSSEPIEGGVISGERRGEAMAGSEQGRLQHDNKVPGAYFYEEGTKPEVQIGGRQHKSTITGNKKIADINGDQEQLFKGAYDKANEEFKAAGDNDTIAHQKALNAAEQHLKDQGFDGYQTAKTRPGTAFLFGDHQVGGESTSAAESAQKFNAARGKPEINHKAPPLNEERAQELASEMDASKHEPNSPEVKSAYQSLINDVKDQWNHAQSDLGIKFEPSEADPYDSYEAVKKDVEENKRLKIFTGGNPLPADHPLAQIDPETGLSYNTMLRGVHDLYGHIAGDNDFSEAGEAGATNAHKQMMSEPSVPALLNETEGQVSQYFHGKDKGNFPPQNATVVPEQFVRDWHETAGKRAAAEEAGAINPRTGTSAKEGVGSEILPELREPLSHPPTAEDFKNFYEKHKDILDIADA